MGHVTGMQYLIPTKHQKEFTVSVIMGATINFIMNIILINLYGAIGAAIGTVIAEFIVSFSQLIFLRKKLNIVKMLIACKDYLIASLIMFLCCIPISYFINSNFICIIVNVGVGAFIYLLSLVLLKNKFTIEIFKMIMKKANIFKYVQKNKKKVSNV